MRQLRLVILTLLIIAFTIATIIIWAMMGRVMADSRRDGRFRAIGAKRSDIAAVYVTYSVWVAVRIVIFAAALGLIIAGTVHVLFADRATKTAQLAYAVFTRSHLQFPRLPQPGALVDPRRNRRHVADRHHSPLLRNIRRNPIGTCATSDVGLGPR